MFLQRLLNNPPGDLRADIRRYVFIFLALSLTVSTPPIISTVGQISLSATYGIDVVEDDPYLKIAETAIDAVDAAGTPEAYPFVQAFPMCVIRSWIVSDKVEYGFCLQVSLTSLCGFLAPDLNVKGRSGMPLRRSCASSRSNTSKTRLYVL
jgi:hypothetical protein